jgi:hypothetical protein
VANAGAKARLNASRTSIPKMVWAAVFNGDKGKKTGEVKPAVNRHCRHSLREPIPEKSRMANTPQHVNEETWPINTKPVIITEAMTEPKAEEKTNVSAGPEKFKFQIFLVKILPALRKPSINRRNRTTSICGERIEGFDLGF